MKRKPLRTRKPLRRSVGLTRKRWMPRFRRRERRSERVQSEEYCFFVRGLLCCVDHEHAGPVEAHHHTGRRPMGRKASDFGNLMPLCTKGHREFHGATGWAKRMNRAERREWQDRESLYVLWAWNGREGMA